MTTDSSPLRINLQAILACLLWATAVVAVKAALEHQPPLTLAGLRFTLSGLLLIPLSGSWKEPFRLLRHEFKTVLLVSIYQTIYLYATFFYAMTLARGAEAAIIIGMGPLASALVAHWTMKDDPLNRQTLFSIGLGVAGIVLVSLASKPWNPTGLKEFFGLMLLLSGSFVSALGNVTVAKRKGALHPVALCSAQMLLGGPILLLGGLTLHGPQPIPLTPDFLLLLLWLAIISAAGFSIWFHLLTKVKVSKLNIWKFIVPLFGAGLSWWLIPDETPTAFSLCGMLLIVTAIIIGQRTHTA
jgi:drug/metabolite transporter (DMT)-like permease